jgi:NADH-quinone oxidoreductase subunit L
MIFVVFHGEPRDHHAYEHAHESPSVMTVPLIILAVGALLAGFLNLPAIFGGNQIVSHWLAPSLTEQHPHASILLEVLAIGASVIAFAIGFKIAYTKFGHGAPEPSYSGFADFAYHKFYVDELYDAIIVQPYKAIGSSIWKIIEPNVTDAPVKGVARLYMVLGAAFKIFQVGYVRVYAIYMVLGLSIMSLLLSQSMN